MFGREEEESRRHRISPHHPPYQYLHQSPALKKEQRVNRCKGNSHAGPTLTSLSGDDVSGGGPLEEEVNALMN